MRLDETTWYHISDSELAGCPRSNPKRASRRACNQIQGPSWSPSPQVIRLVMCPSRICRECLLFFFLGRTLARIWSRKEPSKVPRSPGTALNAPGRQIRYLAKPTPGSNAHSIVPASLLAGLVLFALRVVLRYLDLTGVAPEPPHHL